MRKRLKKWLFTLAFAATLTVSANGVTAYAAEVPETETVMETIETVEATETEETVETSETQDAANALSEPDMVQVPEKFDATALEHGVLLSWEYVDGADGYEISQYTTSVTYGDRYDRIADDVIGLNYTVEKLDVGKEYWYVVRAYKNVDGKRIYSGYSTKASAVPIAKKPASVTNVTATPGFYSVSLTWDVAEGATRYEIYSHTDSTDSWYLEGETDVPSFSKKYIDAKEWTWYVRAVRTQNGIDEYAEKDAVCNFEPKEIGKVTDLKASSTELHYELTWSPIEGASYYKVISNNETVAEVKDCHYVVGPTIQSKEYRISAVWSDDYMAFVGDSSDYVVGKPIIITPAKVTNLKATGMENAVKLTWSKSKDATSYIVYRYDTSTDKYTKVTATSATSYTIKNLKAGSYTYSVAVVHTAFGITSSPSGYSAKVTAKVTQVVPAKVTGLKGTAQENAVKLKWTASKNATQYKIYMYDKNGKKTVVATTKSTSYTVKGLEATKTQFSVLAQRVVNGRTVDASAKSSKVSVTPTTKTPGKVKNLTAAIGSGKVALSWSKATNATGYNIYKYDTSKKNYVKIGTTKSNTYTVTGLKNGTEYRFKVRAYRNVNSLVKSGEMTSAVRATPGKVTNGWNTVDGKRYYYKNGKALTGKQTISGNVYYFNKSGVMQMGWVYYDGYKFYHSKATGMRMRDVTKFLTSSQKKSYQIKVNKKMNTVTVYAKDGSNGYIIPVKAFICSTGTTTPVGTFKIYSQVRWAEMMGPSWGQWVSKFYGGYWFHSVFYNSYNNNNDLSVSAYNKLGTTCSHGCIRMTAADVKWIYDNTNTGATVVIYNSSTSGPFGKPSAVKLPSWHTWDPTDPNMAYKCKAKGCH